MDIKSKITEAENNLKRKLDWIARHDSRIAFASGAVVAMMGVLVSASGSVIAWQCWTYLLFGVPFILLLISVVLIYLSQFPTTKSPNSSLLFFGTIAGLPYNEFNQKFKERTDEDYLDDLLCQIHINSIILRTKFFRLKMSFMLMGIALLPWLGAIYYSKQYLK